MKVVATVHPNWMDLIKQEAAKRKGKKQQHHHEVEHTNHSAHYNKTQIQQYNCFRCYF